MSYDGLTFCLEATSASESREENPKHSLMISWSGNYRDWSFERLAHPATFCKASASGYILQGEILMEKKLQKFTWGSPTF